MILTCVHVTVKKEFIENFIQATLANHFATRQEQGNLRFDVIQQENDPEKFVLYEAFESEEAAAFHKTTLHYQTWRDTVQDWMALPRQGIRFNVIEPKNKELW
ncbi:MAG: antibiotic biosynthesis monooxygenase [Bacteroidales bacterium]|nr:antibiotic biosynthesis monooxygenase [Bacteroidales bacterium]